MSSTLMTHRGAVKVTRAQLADIPAPEPTPTWRPVSHAQLVSALTDILIIRGFAIRKEEFAVQSKGNLLFGVLDFSQDNGKADDDPTKMHWSMGFHTSQNKALALKIACGSRVVVCDNLGLSGSLIALYRRHTAQFDIHVELMKVELMKAVRAYETHAPRFIESLEALQEKKLSILESKTLTFELFRNKVLPL